MDENCEINFEFDNMIHISIDNIYKLFLSFKVNWSLKCEEKMFSASFGHNRHQNIFGRIMNYSA